MPRTLMTEINTEEAVDLKVRGLVQITQDGEMWNCRVAIFNSKDGLLTSTLNAEKVVELFKACGVPQPVSHAESHIVEFFDGPTVETLTTFGFAPLS